jgi:hypothetical protein
MFATSTKTATFLPNWYSLELVVDCPGRRDLAARRGR